jgi:hypothetical protein
MSGTLVSSSTREGQKRARIFRFRRERGKAKKRFDAVEAPPDAARKIHRLAMPARHPECTRAILFSHPMIA